jgi:hypothetical protein
MAVVPGVETLRGLYGAQRAALSMELNVLRGYIDGPSSSPASLIVFDFRLANTSGRRVRRPEIRVSFSGAEVLKFDPYDIVAVGKWVEFNT